LQRENNVSVRRALIQSLGGLNSALIPPMDRRRIVQQLRTAYANDPEPGIHASVSWTLQRWGEDLPELPIGAPVWTDEQKRPTAAVTAQGDLAEAESGWRGARWYVNSQEQTMVVIAAPADASSGRPIHTYAISSHEVTVAQFRRFLPEHGVDLNAAPVNDCPVHKTTWYQAAEYCNWLSKQEEIPEDQWVYLPNEQGQFGDGMSIKGNYQELIGYRLPNEIEWEFACRGQTEGTYCFGEPVALLEQYAGIGSNTAGHSFPVGSLLPNAFGLFDMHGNVWEWTQNREPDSLLPVRHDARCILRGGSFRQSYDVRSVDRVFYPPGTGYLNYGFRLAKTCDL
jgi:hypothetical protein